MRSLFLAILMASALSKSAFACTEATMKQSLAPALSAHNTGISALLSKENQPPCMLAIGQANLALSVALKPEHRFEIGSITKLFTATATLLLAQENTLQLNDDIRQYIKGIETAPGKITIHHLLSHTSGLVDPINQPEFMATRLQESVTLEALVTQFKNNHWQHTPGERINYSNVGYSMLAYIIEKVTHQTYQEFMQERIFNPLQMHSTEQASFAVQTNKVNGYTYAGNTPREHDLLNLNWAYGAGDLVSNTRDLMRFNKALMKGNILDAKHLAQLIAPLTLNDGTRINGSYNLSLGEMNGDKILRMSGSTLGYSAHQIYVPKNDLYAVVLSNSDGVNGGAWVPPATLAAKLVADALEQPLPDFQSVALSAKQAQSYTGQYRLDQNTVRHLIYEEQKFYYQRNDGPRYQVFPMSHHGFYFKDTLSYFYIEETAGQASQMAFYTLLSDAPARATKIH